MALAALVFIWAGTPAAHAGSFLSSVTCDKAMYSPGNGATIAVTITNGTGSAFNGFVTLSISHLGYVSTNLPSQTISSLGTGATNTTTFSWLPPSTNYQGYLISVSVLNSGSNVVDSGSSAIDVSSDWSKFPRYGYVTQFSSGLNASNLMWQLKNYHLNGIQFYDWQWKHHIPYNSGSTWPDVANRTIYQSTVTSLIAAAHSCNMLAMNYNSYGAAYANYASDGSGVQLSMGIFSNAMPAAGYTITNQLNDPLPAGWATPALYEMNNSDTNWQNYIYGREQTVFGNFSFDGWHIDTLGQHTAYDSNGNYFSLDDYNPQFINNAKTALGKRMVFNAVDGGGENQVAQSANVDFVYAELWSGNANYNDFNEFVNNVRSYCSKASVFAAYMDTGVTNGYFNDAGVRLTDAAMFACGAAHMEMGDGTDMLSYVYYPADTSVVMTSSLTAAMHSYYDFLVGYENLLRDGTVSANNQVSITSVNTSTNGSTGTAWTISKQTLGYNIVHFVNLLNSTSTQWNDYYGTYAAPPMLTNLAVKMYYTGAIAGGRLWYASPDSNSGAATQLSYATGSDGGGNYVNFTVPQLKYWDMIWLEIDGTTSAGTQIQAANYDSMSAIGTETTSDTGGGLVVCSVNNTNGDGYVAFNNIDFGSGYSSVSARVASALTGGTVEFHLDSPTGTVVATVPVGNTGGWQSWQTVTVSVSGASGLHQLFAVFKYAASNLNWFEFSPPNPSLPSPWCDVDVGSVGVSGAASYLGGTFTVSGSGADIWNAADAFQYVYQPVIGNATIIAYVASQQDTDPWAKAGVMWRGDLTPGAVFADVVVTPGNGVNFQWRNTPGGPCGSAGASGIAAPTWVKLVGSGSSFSAYYGSDGSTWTQIGTSTSLVVTGDATQVGLAVCSHNNTETSTATFDNVNVSGLLAYWTFDEGGGSIAYDYSGSSNTGTVVLGGGNWTSGMVNSALSFDGQYTQVTVPNALSLNPVNGITVAVWVNDTSGGWFDDERIVEKGETDNQYSLFANSSGQLEFLLAGVSNGVLTASAPSSFAWHHLAATYDGSSTMSFYIDGQLAAQQSATGFMPVTTDPLAIGNKPGNSSGYDFFQGIIDDVRIYGSALSAAQIAQLYNADSVGDGIPNWWRLQWFGSSSSTNAASCTACCATCDADGTGQNNLFKYVAGLNPTDPTQVFTLQIAPVVGQPNEKNLIYKPLAAGRTYTIQSTSNMVGGVYTGLSGFNGPQTNGSQATVTDQNAGPTNKFYRVQIALP